MADALPDPLVPADVDLNGYEYMPLYGERLRRSQFNRATPEAKWAGLMLWWASWWERPAASLPSSEIELARLADCKDLRTWRRVRACAMHGWVLCSDNRWYHPILGDMAVTTFASRRRQSAKGRIGANKRWGIKDATDGTGNSPAISTRSTGISRGNGTGNSNRSKGSSNKHLPVVTGTSTAPPPPTAIEENLESTPPLASTRGTTWPDGGPAEFARRHGVKVRKPQPASFDEP